MLQILIYTDMFAHVFCHSFPAEQHPPWLCNPQLEGRGEGHGIVSRWIDGSMFDFRWCPAKNNAENLKKLKRDDEDLISLWRPGIINFTLVELMERLNQEYLAVTWFKMEDLNEVVRSTADHCCNIFMVCGMFAGCLRLCSCMVSVQWFDAMLLHRVGNILQARSAMKKKSEFVFYGRWQVHIVLQTFRMHAEPDLHLNQTSWHITFTKGRFVLTALHLAVTASATWLQLSSY